MELDFSAENALIGGVTGVVEQPQEMNPETASALGRYVTAIFEGDADTIEEYSFKKWNVDGDSLVYEDIDEIDIDVFAVVEYPNEGALEDVFESLSKSRFNKKDVEEAYAVYMLLTVTYNGEEYEGACEASVYKVDGEWYVNCDIDIDEDFEEEYEDDHRRNYNDYT